MPFKAEVYRLFIASPSDVTKERGAVRQIVDEWNVVNAASRRMVLLSVGWDSHAVPQMGQRPQEHINETVLKDCDMLVGIFWTRMGSDAGKGMTGTAEEIEKHLASGKPARLYFSSKPVPHNVDTDQLNEVRAFKERIGKERRGMYAEFSNIQEFKDSFRNHLGIEMNSLPTVPRDAEQNSQVVTPQSAEARKRREHVQNVAGLAQGEDKTLLQFTAHSSRMRPSEAEHEELEFSWNELFAILAPLIAAGGFTTKLKECLEQKILKRLNQTGVRTRHGTNFEHVTVSDGDFARISFQFAEIGYVTQNLVNLELTEAGREWARQLATARK